MALQFIAITDEQNLLIFNDNTQEWELFPVQPPSWQLGTQPQVLWGDDQGHIIIPDQNHFWHFDSLTQTWSSNTISTPSNIGNGTGIYGTSYSLVHYSNGDKVMRWDGVSWSYLPTPGGNLNEGIWHSSANDVWVCTFNSPSEIWNWDGATWTNRKLEITSGVSRAPRTLWGNASGDMWVGFGLLPSSAMLTHFDGVTATDYPRVVSSPPTVNIQPPELIYGTDINNVVHVGHEYGGSTTGRSYVWDGGWTLGPAIGQGTNGGLAGRGMSDIWWGANRHGVRHYDGVSWSTYTGPFSSSSYTWRFITLFDPIIDVTAPTLTNQNPTAGATDVLISNSISFSINDDITGVDLTTVRVYVDAILVWDGSVFTAGWTASTQSANGNNGYDFVLTHASVFAYADTILVEVYAEDTAGNILDTSYSFITETAPFTINPLRHSFTVPDIDIVKLPRSIYQPTQFDDHGSLLSLPRIRDEKNWAYRRRMLDVFSHVANSGYRGLVHGITRELGLSLISPITIDPKVDGNERFLAPDPYIKFDGAYVYLYSDFTNDLLDYKIDRFEPGGNYEQISRLIDLVNTTAYFEANLIPGYDGQARSMTILNQSNRETVAFELVQPSNRFRLEHKHIVPGTLFFSNRDLFKTEVYSEDAVDSQGKYYINYLEGIVTSYSIAVGLDYVRYQYVRYPFRPVASPIILCDINMNSFKDKMFELINDADNNEIHGLPTEIGVDIINELLEVTPMYWGV